MTSTFDIVTIIVASVALIVSIITLIKQFFWKSLSFNGTLVGAYIPEGPIGTTDLEFIFANTGDVVLIIKEVLIDPVNSRRNLTSPIIHPDGIPAILKPDQMQMVKVSVPSFLFRSALNEGLLIKIFFVVISPKGKIHHVAHDVQPKAIGGIELDQSVWLPFKLLKGKHEVKK